MKSTLFPNKKVRTIVIVFGLAMAAVLAAALAIILSNRSQPPQSDALRFSGDYLLMSDDNVFVYKNAKQTVEILENGTGVVFMGFPTCPWCQAYVPLLDEVAKELGLKEIYYLDVYDDRSDNTPEYQRLVELMGHHLLTDDNDNPRIYVPDVTVVKDGVILGHNNDTSTLSGMDPSDYWTISLVRELQQELREMIRQIL